MSNLRFAPILGLISVFSYQTVTEDSAMSSLLHSHPMKLPQRFATMLPRLLAVTTAHHGRRNKRTRVKWEADSSQRNGSIDADIYSVAR